MTEYVLLLWLADVVGGLSGLLGFVATMSGVLAFTFWIARAEEERWAQWWAPRLTAICLLAALCCVIVPSKSTVHKVIALKAGHDISQTQTAGKALDALNADLHSVIEKSRAKQ